MKGTLDEIESSQKRFSKLSLMISMITFVFLGYLFLRIPKTIKVGEELSDPPTVIVAATVLFCLLGMIMMILSFINKEPSTWFKWIGAIVNITWFSIIVGSVIFAMVI